jgi:hypothetical protein
MPKPEESSADDVKITESEEPNKKYLLICVPDFDDDPSGNPSGGDRYGSAMTSYLRLGVPKESDYGDELIEHAYAVGAVGFTGTVKLPGGEVPVAFVDDERNRGGVGPGGELIEPFVADGHHLTVAQRYNFHTKHLKSKGGWRDHSDGNRISTTYGDKVEVIRGNYKLVVMGRQDDPGNSQGHEWCGNHVQDWGQGTMPGASTTLEWIQDGYVPDATKQSGVKTDARGRPYITTSPAVAADPARGIEAVEEGKYRGGVWLLINSTERVYQYDRNAGNFRTQQWGDKLESYTGSENPERIGTTRDVGYAGHPDPADHKSFHKVLGEASAVPTDPVDAALQAANGTQNTVAEDLAARLTVDSRGLPRGNPDIIEKTWANSIKSYTGTTAWHIPSIYEETWATSTEDYTEVGTAKSTEKITTKTETSTIGSQVSTTTVGALVETTTIGTHVSTTTAGAVVDSTFVGAKNETTIAGALGEITVCPIKASIELMIGSLELSVVGVKRALTIGVGKEWKIGDVEEIKIPKKRDVALEELKMTLNATVAALEYKQTSLQMTNFALAQTFKALSVQLGT